MGAPPGPLLESTRLSVYKETLWGPLMWTIDGILLLLSWGDLASRLFPSTEELLRRLALLSSLSWHLKITIILAANVLLIGEGAFRAVRKREREIRTLHGRLEEINNTRPAIRLDEPGAIYIEFVSQTYGGTHFDSVPFLKVRYVNSPAGPFPSANAEGVRATINYYRSPDHAFLLSIQGRWADSDQPSAISPLASKSHLLPITFGIGEPHSLDIAYRDAQTGQYFAWNNDNYSYPFFRYEHHRLEGTEFEVEIRLLGVWVDERFSFTFKTTNDGFVLP
jgi:hypothetical protein